MPQARQQNRRNRNSGDTDTTSDAQGRFVVSLPAEVRKMVDDFGEEIAEQLEQSTGIAVVLSPAQIVQAMIRQAVKNADGNNE